MGVIGSLPQLLDWLFENFSWLHGFDVKKNIIYHPWSPKPRLLFDKYSQCHPTSNFLHLLWRNFGTKICPAGPEFTRINNRRSQTSTHHTSTWPNNARGNQYVEWMVAVWLIEPTPVHLAESIADPYIYIQMLVTMVTRTDQARNDYSRRLGLLARIPSDVLNYKYIV